MPTASASVGGGADGACGYALQSKKELPKEKQRVVLVRNNVYGTAREMGFQMKEISNERPAVKKPVLHLQINFHPEEKPSQKAAQKAIDSILKDIGIDKENHQYVVVQHRDKAHDHYHVVANRVGLDGSLMNDHRILDRLQVACDKVEKLQKLRPTENRTVVYDPTQSQGYSYVKSEKKEKINDKNEAVKSVKEYVKESLVSALRTIEAPAALKLDLHSKGIEVNFLENVKGIYGVSFRYRNIAVKGSEVGFKWAELSKGMEANKAELVPLEKLIAYIEKNPDNIESPIQLVDESIRKEMLKINPEQNPWETWNNQADPIKAYNILFAKAEQVIKWVTNLIKYIQNNPDKIEKPIQLVDEAIRKEMIKIDPEQNPWETWKSQIDSEKAYDILHKEAEMVINSKEVEKQIKSVPEVIQELILPEIEDEEENTEKKKSRGIRR